MDNQIDYPKEYDNSGRVENSKELLDKFISDSALFRETHQDNAELDLTYGPQHRNMMDIFWPGDEAGQAKKSPIVLFIHGGYWQILDRSAFSHLSAGLNANGIAVAMPSYTLCPDINIQGIINELRRACLVLYQTYHRKITVIGHSAGGHLAACMMATDWTAIHPQLPDDLVQSGLGISGIYDLIPITKTPVNDAVGMDEEEAHAASPVHWMPEALHRFEAWVGEEESGEYHRQSKDLSNYWTMCGTPTPYVCVAGANHFTVIDQLIQAESPMVQAIVNLVENPTAQFDVPEPDEAAIERVLKSDRQTEQSEIEKAEPAKKNESPKTKTKKSKLQAPLKASIAGKPQRKNSKMKTSKGNQPDKSN